MNIYLFSFTKKACSLSVTLQKHFCKQQIPCTCFTIEKYANTPELTPLTKPLRQQVGDCFLPGNVLIFISACGIAVRSIAPFIRQKTSDPCVLVIDETAQFVISLLSGHMGGGNAFTRKVAHLLCATPVITTATDVNHLFSVDTFAKENNLSLSDMSLAKKISADLLQEIPIGIFGTLPKGPIPKGITREITETGFCISAFFHSKPFYHTLFLIPKQVVLGIGCKKNTPFEALKNFVETQLQIHCIFPESIAAITSIDLKKEETGLLKLCDYYQVPLITYSSDTLSNVPGEFSSSPFVQRITGVDNVCERSALAYNPDSTLIYPKVCEQGMTLAIALLPEKTFCFPEES